MFRLVALTNGWSWDYWTDIRHENRAMRIRDEGPNRHEFLLVASWKDRPSPEEFGVAVEGLLTFVRNDDGHSELHTYSLLDDETWNAFLVAAGSNNPIDPDDRARFEPDTLDGRADPVLVDDLMTLDEALATWSTCGAQVLRGERGHLGGNDPALFPNRR